MGNDGKTERTEREMDSNKVVLSTTKPEHLQNLKSVFIILWLFKITWTHFLLPLESVDINNFSN